MSPIAYTCVYLYQHNMSIKYMDKEYYFKTSYNFKSVKEKNNRKFRNK